MWVRDQGPRMEEGGSTEGGRKEGMEWRRKEGGKEGKGGGWGIGTVRACVPVGMKVGNCVGRREVGGIEERECEWECEEGFGQTRGFGGSRIRLEWVLEKWVSE